MAQGKKQTVTVVVNNNPKLPVTPITKSVELVVVNDQLVPHQNEVNPGVNSIYQ